MKTSRARPTPSANGSCWRRNQTGLPIALSQQKLELEKLKVEDDPRRPSG